MTESLFHPELREPGKGAYDDAVTTFRFRAEVPGDVVDLLEVIPAEHVIRFASVRGHDHLPGEECEIMACGIGLEDLRDYCRQVVDGHVMVQTIQPIEDYTGERDFYIN